MGFYSVNAWVRHLSYGIMRHVPPHGDGFIERRENRDAHRVIIGFRVEWLGVALLGIAVESRIVPYIRGRFAGDFVMLQPAEELFERSRDIDAKARCNVAQALSCM